MATWSEFATGDPEFSARVLARIEGHLHHILGSLKQDGSPRLSGTEVRLFDGDLWLGMMPASLKAKDLRRDARYAVHTAPVDVEMKDGDAKFTGTVEEELSADRIRDFLASLGHEGTDGGPPDPAGALAFRLGLDSVTLTEVAGDHLDVTTWTPSGGRVVRAVQ